VLHAAHYEVSTSTFNLQIVQDPAKKTKISVGRVVTLKTHYSGSGNNHGNSRIPRHSNGVPWLNLTVIDKPSVLSSPTFMPSNLWWMFNRIDFVNSTAFCREYRVRSVYQLPQYPVQVSLWALFVFLFILPLDFLLVPFPGVILYQTPWYTCRMSFPPSLSLRCHKCEARPYNVDQSWCFFDRT